MTSDDLEQIDDETFEALLIGAVEDGDATSEFLGTTLGKSLIRRAKSDYLAALIHLVNVDLGENLDEARRLQMKARVAEQTLAYLAQNLKDRDMALARAESQQG